MEENELLRKISAQLDMLISLSKLAYSGKIDKVRREIAGDETMAKIMEMVPENLSSGDLVSAVGAQVKQKERTIRVRLSYLVGKGILKVERVGKESFYQSTGLI